MGTVAFTGSSDGGWPNIAGYVKVLKRPEQPAGELAARALHLGGGGDHRRARAGHPHRGRRAETTRRRYSVAAGRGIAVAGDGLSAHQYLHRTHALERWAMFRLVAEVARSVTAIGPFHVYLEHLFTLPLSRGVAAAPAHHQRAAPEFDGAGAAGTLGSQARRLCRRAPDLGQGQGTNPLQRGHTTGSRDPS